MRPNPVIMCAICQRPVDRVEWRDDLNTGDRVITAHCHGDRDTMRLSQADLISMIGKEPTSGVAFADKRVGDAA